MNVAGGAYTGSERALHNLHFVVHVYVYVYGM